MLLKYLFIVIIIIFISIIIKDFPHKIVYYDNKFIINSNFDSGNIIIQKINDNKIYLKIGIDFSS